METPIPIIDIFAGPGDLGEGFSALTSGNKNPLFRIRLSIEKDKFAHKTLELRAFFRQFARSAIPSEYYEYLQGKKTRMELFKKYKVEALQAKNEAWNATLGKSVTRK